MINLAGDLAAGAEVARLVKTASLDPAKPMGGNQIHSDESAKNNGF